MLISVIIPVFDPPVERFKRCIQSVLDQDNQDWEILIINDGSKDAEIIEFMSALSEYDSRIRVYSQPNKGPGAARNVGTSEASGDYVTYLDADDELTRYALSDAKDKIRITGADVIVGHLQRIASESGKITRLGSHEDLVGLDNESLTEFTLAGLDRYKLMKREQSVIKNGPIARFIKLSLARQIVFPEDISVNEDTIWNLDLFRLAESILITDSIWYWYWISHDSTSRGYREDSVTQMMMFLELLATRTRNSDSKRIRTLTFMRTVNEVYRVTVTFYARTEANMSTSARISGTRQLLLQNVSTKDIDLRLVFKTRPKVFLKYFLCWTGLAPALLRTLARPN